jgi:D-sedoheptulose 7-phosphate isomerase
MDRSEIMSNFSYRYIENLKKVLDEFPHADFGRLLEVLLNAYHDEKRIFVMGNGGSATTASHWACDINKGCCVYHEKKFKMICLNDSISTVLAYANDLSYAEIFVEQLKNFFIPGDVVIGISASGNSKNIITAINYANANNGITIGVCGFSGGKLYQSVTIPLLIKSQDMQQIEDMHLVVGHLLMQKLNVKLGQCPPALIE